MKKLLGLIAIAGMCATAMTGTAYNNASELEDLVWGNDKGVTSYKAKDVASFDINSQIGITRADSDAPIDIKALKNMTILFWYINEATEEVGQEICKLLNDDKPVVGAMTIPGTGEVYDYPPLGRSDCNAMSNQEFYFKVKTVELEVLDYYYEDDGAITIETELYYNSGLDSHPNHKWLIDGNWNFTYEKIGDSWYWTRFSALSKGGRWVNMNDEDENPNQ